MKTPTTITVIAWNYCQNRCSYCVSESCTERWKLNGKKEVWIPEGDEDLNYYELCEKHGFKFHDNMCPEPEKYLDANDVLDFDYAIKWIKEHRPGAHIHISGGEPLLRPDIEDIVEKVSAEFETTIVTNGQLISKRPRLLDMPVKWLVTYHLNQIPFDKWLAQARLIKDKPHLATVVMTYEMRKNGWKAPKELQEEFNFEYRWNTAPKLLKDFKYNPEDLGDVASHRIMIIQPNGPVMGCNKPQRGPWERYKSHSNVYTGACDEKQLSEHNERADNCIKSNRCAAYQTAVIMSKISKESQ